MPAGWIWLHNSAVKFSRILTFDFQLFCVNYAKLMGDLVALSKGMFHNSDGAN